MTTKEYFESTVNKVITQTGCTIQFTFKMVDHEKTETGKHKKALGIAYIDLNVITIDDYFVEECYNYFINNSKITTWELNAITLEECICHEIAHFRYFRHGKKHNELTQELLSMVELPEKYYRYLEAC
jgi:hypothetical protein